jgi:hypothetical protein
MKLFVSAYLLYETEKYTTKDNWKEQKCQLLCFKRGINSLSCFSYFSNILLKSFKGDIQKYSRCVAEKAVSFSRGKRKFVLTNEER